MAQNNTIKVPQSVIDEIRKIGMAGAIKKAKSGSASREFVEGVRRFYPKAVAGVDELTAKRETKGVGAKPNPGKQIKPAPPPPSPAAVSRRVGSRKNANSTKPPLSENAAKLAQIERQNARPSKAKQILDGTNDNLRTFQKAGRSAFEDKINPALRRFQAKGKAALQDGTKFDPKRKKNAATRNKY